MVSKIWSLLLHLYVSWIIYKSYLLNSYLSLFRCICEKMFLAWTSSSWFPKKNKEVASNLTGLAENTCPTHTHTRAHVNMTCQHSFSHTGVWGMIYPSICNVDKCVIDVELIVLNLIPTEVSYPCVHKRFVFVCGISLTAQRLASPAYSPLTTASCHHIHILLLFPAPLPVHSGSVCNPFIVTEVWH